MPSKVIKDDDTTSGDEDIENAGGWAQGLSKGVFAHKRSSGNKRKLKSPRKQSRKKRKTDSDKSQEESDSYFAECLGSGSSIKVEDRVKCYNEIVRRQEQEVERLQEQVFSGVFDNIVQFVRDTVTPGDTIPTAALLTGVNMPDHNKVLSIHLVSLYSLY